MGSIAHPAEKGPIAMPLTGAQTNLYADDPQALAVFYAGLGLTERFRFPAEGAPHLVEMAIGGFTLGLLDRRVVESVTPLACPKGPPQAELVLWCDDAAATHAAAVADGAPALTLPATYANRLTAAWIADPEGNRVKLVSHPRGGPT